MKLGWIIFGLITLGIGCGRAPNAEDPPVFSQDVFLSRELIVGSDHARFRVYLPKSLPEAAKPPVMLFLHGSEERGDDNESQLSGPAPSILTNPNNFRFVIVFPQCPRGRFWDKELIERAMAELDQTVKEFNGDASRLYLAGFSLGGYGTWTAAAMYPQKFAAVVPMSGRVVPRPGERKSVAPEIIELADAADPYAAFAERLKKTPVWIFHGADDKIVPLENSRRMARALKEVGSENARYSELENTGHVSLTAAFNDPELFTWLSAQHKNE